MAINPADWWGPEPKAIEKPSGGRVVRLCHDDEEGEAIMPKGQYDRSKAKPRGSSELTPDAPAAPAKKPRKARSTAVVPKVAKTNGDASAGRFDVSVNLRSGGVTINASGGSLALARDEVLALFAFLGGR
jgi:hypothetical protein